MKKLKNIEEAGLFKDNDNQISMKEFMQMHEADLAEVMQELERSKEWGE